MLLRLMSWAMSHSAQYAAGKSAGYAEGVKEGYASAVRDINLYRKVLERGDRELQDEDEDGGENND